MIVQDWDYDTALYYSVISLSTIGFGDYVAGTSSNSFARNMNRTISCIII